MYPCGKVPITRLEKVLRQLMGAWGLKGDTTTTEEHEKARVTMMRLTFGEVMPRGVRQLMLPGALDAANAKTMVDLGCGKGRLALQAFLEYVNLTQVLGVEFCRSRYDATVTGIKSLASLNSSLMSVTESKDKLILTVDKNRTLEIRHQDLFQCAEVRTADIVVCETAFSDQKKSDLAQLLTLCQPGTRIVLYQHLTTLPNVVPSSCDLMPDAEVVVIFEASKTRTRSKKIRKELARFVEIARDRFYETSWDPSHRFNLWFKLS